MKTKLRIVESALLAPVSSFLKGQGCMSLVPELRFFDRGIDIYAYAEQAQCSYAVELKLTDWQKALRQAAIYQLCADLCYVAMPSDSVAKADVSEFEQAGVGLLSVQLSSKAVTELLAAKTSVVKSQFYSHCFYQSLSQGGYKRASTRAVPSHGITRGKTICTKNS